jgi:hypothetical protein
MMRTAFDNVKGAHPDRAKGTHPFVNGFKVNRRSRACGNCGKPSRVFQAAEEIIKKMAPKATLVDFLGCGSFHKRPLPQFFLFGSFSFFVQIRLRWRNNSLHDRL